MYVQKIYVLLMNKQRQPFTINTIKTTKLHRRAVKILTEGGTRSWGAILQKFSKVLGFITFQYGRHGGTPMQPMRNCMSEINKMSFY